MLKTKSLAVKLLSLSLGLLGAVTPMVLLLIDETPYDADAFLAYAFLFGFPGFVLPFVLTRAVAWVIRSRR